MVILGWYLFKIYGMWRSQDFSGLQHGENEYPQNFCPLRNGNVFLLNTKSEFLCGIKKNDVIKGLSVRFSLV